MMAPVTARTAPVQAVPPESALAARLDTLLAASYPATGPGATMVVTRGGRTIYAGASGLADIALDGHRLVIRQGGRDHVGNRTGGQNL